MFCKVGSLTSKNDTYFGNFQPTGEESTFILDLFQGDFQGTRMAWGAFFVQVFFLYCKFLFSFCVLRRRFASKPRRINFPSFSMCLHVGCMASPQRLAVCSFVFLLPRWARYAAFFPLCPFVWSRPYGGAYGFVYGFLSIWQTLQAFDFFPALLSGKWIRIRIRLRCLFAIIFTVEMPHCFPISVSFYFLFPFFLFFPRSRQCVFLLFSLLMNPNADRVNGHWMFLLLFHIVRFFFLFPCTFRLLLFLFIVRRRWFKQDAVCWQPWYHSITMTSNARCLFPFNFPVLFFTFWSGVSCNKAFEHL